MKEINKLANIMVGMPQASTKIYHLFEPGIYKRVLILPPWTVIAGAKHKTDYIVHLEKGKIAVNNDKGEIVVLEGPMTFESNKEFQRVGYALDQGAIWTDIYDNPDNCRDIDKLEERLCEIPEYGLMDKRKLESITRDRNDYLRLLDESGISQENENKNMHVNDLITMPGDYQVEVRPSEIHGLGLFAKSKIDADSIICPFRVSNCRTVAGRFSNHTMTPNAIPYKMGNDIWIKSRHEIHANAEICIDYRDIKKCLLST